MNVTPPLWKLLTSGAFFVTSALASVVVSRSIAAPVLACAAVVLAVVLVRYVMLWTHDYFRRRRGGIARVYTGRDRPAVYARVWQLAKSAIYCYGVGMTSLVRDVGPIEEAVKNGRQVTIEMIDPFWLRESPERQARIDAFYNRTNFVDEISRSLAALVELRNRLNREYGQKVRIVVYQELVYKSGTLADPDDPGRKGWGYIEDHSPGFPMSHSVFEIYNYPSTLLTPSCMEKALDARRQIPKRVVGTLTTDGPGDVGP